jgi:hypothetical protein
MRYAFVEKSGSMELGRVGSNLTRRRVVTPVLVTQQETSQPNRAALEYWADGLEPIYLEGALARAQGRLL